MNVTSYQKFLAQKFLADNFTKVWATLTLRERMLMMIGHRVATLKGGVTKVGVLHFDAASDSYKLPMSTYFGLSEVERVDLEDGPTASIVLN